MEKKGYVKIQTEEKKKRFSSLKILQVEKTFAEIAAAQQMSPTTPIKAAPKIMLKRKDKIKVSDIENTRQNTNRRCRRKRTYN